MGLSFRKKSAKNYIQFTTRFEEDIMLQLRKLNQKTGLSINEIINRCIRYALDNSKLVNEIGFGFIDDFDSNLEKTIRSYLEKPEYKLN